MGAEKFECVLVSKDPTQYMFGLVPFSFSGRNTATKAADKLKEQDVLEITSPAFDAKARVEFNGCPPEVGALTNEAHELQSRPLHKHHLVAPPRPGLGGGSAHY